MSLLDFLKGVLSLFISNFPEFISRLFKKIPSELIPVLDAINYVVNQIKISEGINITVVLDAIVKSTNNKVDDAVWAAIKDFVFLGAESLNITDNAGNIKFPEDETARALKLISLSGYVNSLVTGSEPAQSALTGSVYYKGSEANA